MNGFKFRLGAVVQKSASPETGLYRVIGLLLDDYINIRSLETHRAEIVDGTDYEKVEVDIKQIEY
tara:strand:- start:660 stop:854 length:195 start_codon:yes stop_codon:yes gene_type:complete